MCASGGVDVMVARPPAKFRRIDPALNLKRGHLSFASNLQLAFLDNRFRPSREFDCVSSFRQFKTLAVRSIYLRMKRKIGGEPLILRRIDPSGLVANDKTAGGRFSIFILNPQSNLLCRRASEQNRDF